MTNPDPNASARARIRYANIQSDSIEDNEAHDFARLYNKQGISFKQKGSIMIWPDWCSNYFNHIQELGTFKHDSYANTNRPKDLNEPWRRATKRRAQILVDRVNECKEGVVGEATWRFRLEPLVFQRFEIEVAWLDFRALFPPMENLTSTAPNAAEGYGALNLKPRQPEI
jgi:hypothetical protein